MGKNSIATPQNTAGNKKEQTINTQQQHKAQRLPVKKADLAHVLMMCHFQKRLNPGRQKAPQQSPGDEGECRDGLQAS